MMHDKKEAEEEARERDAGACSTLDPPSSSCSPYPSSVLVLFRGLPGVGKSTLASAVSLELGNAPLVDKDDTRDAHAEVFSKSEEEENGELFRQRLNEASYAAAFNAARTLLLSSRCPCVLLDSPLSRPSAAERALRLAEELKREKVEEESDGGVAAPSSSSLAFVVVAVGTSDEGLWRRRLEGRAAALAASGSFSARHKPQNWAEVEALRDRGRRELLLGEEEGNGGGGGGGERGDSTSRSSFGERMLRELGVDRPNSLPFSRLWRAASARFVVDTAAAGKGEERGGKDEEREARAFMRAAAGRVAAAVRGALAGEGASDDDGGGGSSVVFLGQC